MNWDFLYVNTSVGSCWVFLDYGILFSIPALAVFFLNFKNKYIVMFIELVYTVSNFRYHPPLLSEGSLLKNYYFSGFTWKVRDITSYNIGNSEVEW